jgi:hypothetical protein
VSIASAGAVVPAGVVPVPVSGTFCGLSGALSVTVSCADRVPASVGEKVIETLQLVPTASVSPEQPSPTTVKSSVFAPLTAALLMNSEAVPVLLTVTCCGTLVVPVSRDAKVSDVGDRETAGADVADGVHPDSEADAVVAPSLTVTWHVDELYGVDSILNAPEASLVPETAPGFTTTLVFGRAPLPSTRSCDPFSSDLVILIAA